MKENKNLMKEFELTQEIRKKLMEQKGQSSICKPSHQLELEPQSKHNTIEGDYFDKAFVNLVRRVDGCTQEIDEIGAALIEVISHIKRIEKKQKNMTKNLGELKDEMKKLTEVTHTCKQRVDEVRKTVRNILRINDRKWNIKSKNILVTSEKMMDKVQRADKRCYRLMENKKKNEEI